jgi:uncharacterized RDD family membrane protein YckC
MPSGAPLASWGIRLGGFVIDFIMLYLVNVILGAAFHRVHALRVDFAMTNHNNGTQQHFTFSFLVFIVSGLIFLVYGTLMIGGRGQSLGMMAVGVRAVRAIDEGPVGYAKAFGRTLLQVVLSWTFVLALLSGLWPLWDPKRQTLQDKAAGTVVIRSRSAAG